MVEALALWAPPQKVPHVFHLLAVGWFPSEGYTLKPFQYLSHFLPILGPCSLTQGLCLTSHLHLLGPSPGFPARWAYRQDATMLVTVAVLE